VSHDVQPIEVGAADSIAECFARRVAATPEAIAYRRYDPARQAWSDITWREAAAAVARMRAGLASERLAAGDRVAVMLRNGPDWIAFDQAAHCEGLVVVPLYVDDRPDNVAYCLEDSACRVLLVEGEEHLKKLAEIRERMPTVKRIVCVNACAGASDPRVVSLSDWAPEAEERPRAKVDGNALATIVYTSGTTGRPKGVMLSHQNMLQNVKAALAVYDVYRDDVFLSFLPLSHMLERMAGYYLTMVAGATVAFARSIAQLSEDFRTVRPTVIVSVPRIFEKLHGTIQATLADGSAGKRRLFEAAHRTGWALFEWQQKRGPWRASFLLWPLLRTLVANKLLERLGGRLRLCISGGAALNPQIAHTFIGLGLPICQGYGLTEASPVVSVNHLDRNDPASIGLALPGIEVRFGENSVLLVKGPNVMMGYWNNPEATAKVKSADGWLDTGDQARAENGFLYITGRIKDIIVLGNGEKVPPVDMELAIQLDPLFAQVLVVGEGRPYLAALAVLDANQAAKAGPLGEKQLAARMAAQLKDFPGYAQIRRVAVVEEPWTVANGLLTSTLKPRRAPILERFKAKLEELYEARGEKREAKEKTKAT
jgi:long-chain acyl-CoA synthetase